jgi:putative glutamine amidotransferase
MVRYGSRNRLAEQRVRARIGVSMRVVQNTTYPEPRDALSHDWSIFLDRFGVTPILIPNVLEDPAEFLQSVDADGLLLTNGEDVGVSVPPHRDTTESALVSFAMERRLPVLGVCRGFQFLNVYFGGSLTRDLKGNCPGADEHVSRTGHPVDVIDPQFRGILGAARLSVNSFHNDGVTLENLAAPLRPFAVASGAIVEGWFHPECDVMAIQWHPERVSVAPNVDRALFGVWLDRLKANR